MTDHERDVASYLTFACSTVPVSNGHHGGTVGAKTWEKRSRH
jgi:hypothetical protein